jgi:hypothetical protein
MKRCATLEDAGVLNSSSKDSIFGKWKWTIWSIKKNTSRSKSRADQSLPSRKK